MEKIEKLKKVIDVLKVQVAGINRELAKEFGVSKTKRMKLEYEKVDKLKSLDNLEKYVRRLELIEKVKRYENNSGRSKG